MNEPSKSFLAGIYRTVVRSQWLDSNGHLTARRYFDIFMDAGDLWCRDMGFGPDYLRSRSTLFTGDMHVTFVREVLGNTTLTVSSVISECDPRRINVHQELIIDGQNTLAATAEQLFLNVDSQSRRTAPFGEDDFARLQSLVADRSQLRNVGRRAAILSGAPDR